LKVSFEEFATLAKGIVDDFLDGDDSWGAANSRMSKLYFDQFDAADIREPHAGTLGQLVLAFLIDEHDDLQFRKSREEIVRLRVALREIEKDIELRGLDAVREDHAQEAKWEDELRRFRFLEKHRRRKKP
jgi:hypothetical protein